ncbi:aldehyde dehydrogenase family protein [Vibrio lentus]|nr:aldehyde dehydrogenase family protein [Vibrio lentus]
MDMETRDRCVDLLRQKHLSKVLEAIELAKQSGATLLTLALPSDGQRLSKRQIPVIPKAFTDCHDDTPHVQQEIFGPVMSVLKFTDEDDVIRSCQ